MNVDLPAALDEWEFRFDVTAPEPIPSGAIDALMDAIIVWAESRALGIGGSSGPIDPRADGSARRWRFRFGLCVTRDDDVIPRDVAAGLLDSIAARCLDSGWRFDGGFRPFDP